MRTLWVVLAACACGGSSKPAMGPPPAPAKIAETEKPEPVERPAPTAAPAPDLAQAPKVASDPEEGGQVASDPEEGGQIASASRPAGTQGLAGIGASGTGAGAGGGRGERVGTGGTASPGTPEVSGDIDREAVKKVVRKNFAQIKYCYEKELQRDPSLNGRVEVRFTIETSGKVGEAKATGIDDNLDRCIESRFKAWLFPKQAHAAVIVYPINFTQQ